MVTCRSHLGAVLGAFATSARQDLDLPSLSGVEEAAFRMDRGAVIAEAVVADSLVVAIAHEKERLRPKDLGASGNMLDSEQAAACVGDRGKTDSKRDG